MRLVILLINPDCKICQGKQYYYQGDIKDGMMLMCTDCMGNTIRPARGYKGRKNVTE